MEYELKKKNNEKKKKTFNPLIIRLIILIVFISANTFAWFIYMTKVDNNITVNVRAWDVVFQSGDNDVESIVNLDVSDIYPGMTPYEYEITALNKSEVSATLSYKILEARILNDTYVTVEGRSERGETALVTDPTSATLESNLLSNYPFSIAIDLSDTEINSLNGSEDYTFSVTWPYEGGDDALDTSWGTLASNYKKNNPGLPSITLKIKLSITQNAS